MITQRTIISGSTWPIFAIFSPNESILGADDQSGPFFRYLKGCCHGNQFSGKWHKLPSFVTLAFWNGMGYCYLNVHLNSISDASVSCKNFVNFGPVTPQSWQSSFVNFWYDTAKKLAYSVKHLRIYIFRFVKGRCHGNQMMFGEMRK